MFGPVQLQYPHLHLHFLGLKHEAANLFGRMICVRHRGLKLCQGWCARSKPELIAAIQSSQIAPTHDL